MSFLQSPQVLNASVIPVTTTNLNGLLSSSDNTLQTALETIDELKIMTNPKYWVFVDNFEGDVLKDQWNSASTSSGGWSVNSFLGGSLLAATGAGDGDAVLSFGSYYPYAGSKNAYMRFKVRLGGVTNRIDRYGFYVDANNYAYFSLDSSSEAEWHFKTSAAGSAQDIDLGIAGGSTKFMTMAIQMLSTGNVTYSIVDEDGNNSVSGTVTAGVVAATQMGPYFGIEDLAVQNNAGRLRQYFSYQDA